MKSSKPKLSIFFLIEIVVKVRPMVLHLVIFILYNNKEIINIEKKKKRSIIGQRQSRVAIPKEGPLNTILLSRRIRTFPCLVIEY